MFREETLDGVKVHRCWHYVPRNARAWKRIVHEGSFVLSSFLRMLSFKSADLVVIISPPLLLGVAAWVLCKLKKTQFVFHVQDLQPDAALGLGMVPVGMFSRMLYRLEAFAYEKAASVSCISTGMVSAITRKGVPSGKLKYFPNGVRLAGMRGCSRTGMFRAIHKIQPGDFLAVYSGNLGVKQGLEIIVQAASLIEKQRIKLVISGDGACREMLAAIAAAAGVRNLLLLPLQPENLYLQMLGDADVCLITQQSGAGAAFFPSKLLTVLAAGKPVLSVADADSELAIIADRWQFGLNVPPGRSEELATAIETLATNEAELSRMSKAGYEFVQQFELETVLADFEQHLCRVGGRHASFSTYITAPVESSD